MDTPPQARFGVVEGIIVASSIHRPPALRASGDRLENDDALDMLGTLVLLSVIT
ncbi:MAG: hypothetical protein IH866_03605 [Chloroflexi bacterium]|nr:hypothetical protein [Chloroflexota bacterium]